MSNYNNGWPLVRLEDVIVNMQPGFAQRPSIENVGVPQLRTNNISFLGNLDLSALVNVKATPDELNKYRIKYGDVVFNNTNSKEWVGKTAFFDQKVDYVFSNHMTRLRPNTSLLDAAFLARYLHYLWGIGFSASRAKQWVNQAAIDQVMLAQFEIPLPSLPEQRRIVAILRQADNLRQLRRESDENAGKLIAAIFSEMFGDPIRDEIGWEDKSLAEFAEITAHLVNPRDSQFSGLPHFGSDNIEMGTGRLIDVRSIEDVEAISSKFLFTEEDVLYSKIRPALRKVATPKSPGLCSADIYPLLPNKNYVTKLFLAQLLRTNHFTSYAIRVSGRAQIPKINREDLLKYRTFLPPIEEQRYFEQKVEEFFAIQYATDLSANKIEALFQSLLTQAFMGKLTEEWREQHKNEIAAENALPGIFSEDGFEAATNQREKLEEVTRSDDFKVEEAVAMSKWEYARKSSRQELVVALSDEQLELYEFISKIQGYFTIETVLAGSGKSQLAVRQGLQLFNMCGLIQQVFLPDRPMRDVVVYVPALRNLTEADRSLEPDLLTLKKFENAAMDGIDSPEGETYS